MRKLRAMAVALCAAMFVLAGSAAAFAVEASPDAGGAQSFDAAPWSDGLVKALIVVIPVVILAFMWWALVRAHREA